MRERRKKSSEELEEESVEKSTKNRTGQGKNKKRNGKKGIRKAKRRRRNKKRNVILNPNYSSGNNDNKLKNRGFGPRGYKSKDNFNAINIATWNIEKLGTKSRTEDQIKEMAEIIKKELNPDFLVIQEVMVKKVPKAPSPEKIFDLFKLKKIKNELISIRRKKEPESEKPSVYNAYEEGFDKMLNEFNTELQNAVASYNDIDEDSDEHLEEMFRMFNRLKNGIKLMKKNIDKSIEDNNKQKQKQKNNIETPPKRKVTFASSEAFFALAGTSKDPDSLVKLSGNLERKMNKIEDAIEKFEKDYDKFTNALINDDMDCAGEACIKSIVDHMGSEYTYQISQKRQLNETIAVIYKKVHKVKYVGDWDPYYKNFYHRKIAVFEAMLEKNRRNSLGQLPRRSSNSIDKVEQRRNSTGQLTSSLKEDFKDNSFFLAGWHAPCADCNARGLALRKLNKLIEEKTNKEKQLVLVGDFNLGAGNVKKEPMRENRKNFIKTLSQKELKSLTDATNIAGYDKKGLPATEDKRKNYDHVMLRTFGGEVRRPLSRRKKSGTRSKTLSKPIVSSKLRPHSDHFPVLTILYRAEEDTMA